MPSSLPATKQETAPNGNLRKFWEREIRGKLRIWASWAAVPFYIYLIYRYPSPEGIAVLALGTFFRVWASGYLRKEGTLAYTGPYALTRNPLYVGSILVAISLPLGQRYYVLTAIVLAVCWWLFSKIIKREEAVLTEKFGADYARFCAATPRFISWRSIVNLPKAASSLGLNYGVFKTNRGWEPVLIAIAVLLVTYGTAYYKLSGR
ncbi:MAG: isoprenylcysteine carboxylmethyltransferase family protein [Proteobacteria bacterium]|nr:MAG: isoprenylcysteine carboxylmethyltransferase family protein [Pseudomonadota bacterium]